MEIKMSNDTEILNSIKDDIKEIKENLNKIFSKINSISEKAIVNSEKIKNLENNIQEMKKDRSKIIKESTQKTMIWVYGLIVATAGSIILILINFIIK